MEHQKKSVQRNFGSILRTQNCGRRPRHVRITLASDRTADISNRQLRATRHQRGTDADEDVGPNGTSVLPSRSDMPVHVNAAKAPASRLKLCKIKGGKKRQATSTKAAFNADRPVPYIGEFPNRDSGLCKSHRQTRYMGMMKADRPARRPAP